MLSAVLAASILMAVPVRGQSPVELTAHEQTISQGSPISLKARGWLDPVTRRNLQVFNVFFTLVLLSIIAVSFFLRHRLKEKVLQLEKVRQELVGQNEFLRLATETTMAGIWDFYPARGTGLLSREWYGMFGYEPVIGEIPLADWNLFVFPQDQPAAAKAFSDYMEGGGKGNFESEFRVRRADGTYCWVLSRGRAIAWDENKIPTRIIGLHLNIQKLKEDQEALRESEENFRSLFRFAPIPMAITSRDGLVLEVNDRLTSILGYTNDDIRTIDQWWDRAYPDAVYRGQVMALWESAIEKAMAANAAIEAHEYHVTCKDGTVRAMIIEATIIGDNLLVSFFDITDRKHAEEERGKLQEQLLQAQKLEAVGVLAGGVAHDFNNMLGAIIGYAELTLGKMDGDSPLRKYIERINDAAQRSADLTRQLLAFARKQTVAPVALDLNESVESMLKLLRRLIGENINLAWLPGKNSCTIRIDPSQLDQVLANLCVNARDAIADVGTVTIETDTVFFDEDYCRFHPGFLPGEYVLLAVSDDGSGMDRETLEHIFDPFFTTKRLGHGTGLGLATVYGIIRQNEGFINVYSEPGTGTTFRIYFRRHAPEVLEQRKEITGDIPMSRGETILIVEDDPTLLEMSAAMLKDLGYNVLWAGTPGEASSLAGEYDDDIHLFITDVIMPEMNGRDLSELIQGIRPGIKILFMSGYSANVIAHQGVLDKGVHFIQKPFSSKDLAAKVRHVLG